MKYKTKSRFTFDYESDRRSTYEKIAQIICSSYWGSGIDIFGFLNDDHRLLFDLILKGVIVIDECEYELQEPLADSEPTRLIKSLLGKRRNHPVLREMAALFGDEPFEASGRYRNTLYLPNLKAFARADGMKPEYITEQLAMDCCDKIILFPYSPLDGKSAYYELSLAFPKENLVDFLHRVDEHRIEKMNEKINQAVRQNIEGYHQATLRLENKSDWKTVEQVTYRAFRDAPPTGADDDGNEALLAHNLRGSAAFVPELDYVAEINGKIVGNIMYTRSKVVNDNGGEWETLTFGPVSVLPKYQRQYIGSALIRRSLHTARELGYRAVLIFGHESYYPRFGFKPASEYGITTADGKNFPAFMALPLYDGALDGVHGRLICDEVYATLDKEEAEKLNAKLAEPIDVDEYISLLPENIKQDVRHVRLMLLMTMQIHGATEKISWGMPTYWRGKNLFHFAAQKNHLGIYPGAEAIEHFAPRLTNYKTSKGAIQFPYKDLTGEHLSLITEIAAWCSRENDDG
jgi:predicted N-acetyltransferase YhbS/uncharacterized protein YdhG (YjbR/CyaY superfamily)